MYQVMASWGLFYALHSLLLLPKIQARLLPFFSGKPRFFRLFYNFASLLLLGVALLALWRFPGDALWSQFVGLQLLGLVGVVFGMWMGKRAFRSYNLPVFLGLRDEVQMPLSVEGMNRYIRHPLYTASLIIFWSALLMFPTTSFLAICLITSVYVAIGYRLEEGRMIKHFGEAYREYIQKVPALFPKLRK